MEGRGVCVIGVRGIDAPEYQESKPFTSLSRRRRGDDGRLTVENPRRQRLFCLPIIL